MNLSERLARNLRNLRGDQTQEAFARKLGISRATLTRLEKADQNITLKTIEQICRTKRCRIEDLFK